MCWSCVSATSAAPPWPRDSFAITSNILVPVVARLTRLPLGVLVMKLLPVGVEASAFAINMSLQNFGFSVGNAFGIGLLGALGGVEPPGFENLPAFNFVCALARLLPILFVPLLIPSGLTAFDAIAPSVALL